jgi:hypothetical protein
MVELSRKLRQQAERGEASKLACQQGRDVGEERHAASVTIPGIHASRPDRPGQATQTKTQSTAHEATRQKRYDESTFSARLAKALRQHGVAMRTARTSSSVMNDIMDQLARLASNMSKSNSDKDVPVRHGPHGPERPPRH